MNSPSRAYSEKRDALRMQINTPATVEIINSSHTNQNEVIDGICHDLSCCGMLLSVDEYLPVGQKLVVTIISQHGHSPMLHALCQVTRSQEGADHSTITGLEITQVLNKPEVETSIED